MISLKNARITDGLPQIVKADPKVQAMSAAIGKQTEKLIEMAKSISVYACIDAAPERVLDLLAMEFRVPMYTVDGYTAEQKRSLVKSALSYWAAAGSGQAVEDICTQIFGDAEIVEWFEVSGRTAGTFRISTSNPNITEDNLGEFRKTVEAVKRLSAHLDQIDLQLSIDGDLMLGMGITTGSTVEFIL